MHEHPRTRDGQQAKDHVLAEVRVVQPLAVPSSAPTAKMLCATGRDDHEEEDGRAARILKTGVSRATSLGSVLTMLNHAMPRLHRL